MWNLSNIYTSISRNCDEFKIVIDIKINKSMRIPKSTQGQG
jgi:hypothetical protein